MACYYKLKIFQPSRYYRTFFDFSRCNFASKKIMKKSTLPVSRKFYSDISGRISSSLSSSPRSAEEAMRIFRDYLDGKSPESSDPMALLAFNMVRVEVDRALERSRRARMRAMSRRKEHPATEARNASGGKELPTAPEEETDAPTKEIPLLSRRERRAAERRTKCARVKWRPLSSPHRQM